MFSRGDRNARGFGDWEFCFFLSTDSCCGSGGDPNLFSVTNCLPVRIQHLYHLGTLLSLEVWALVTGVVHG